MEIHQIRYFLALSESLNFTRAAENCHVSQPALTRAIKALEAELGGDLIRREGRTSHLTELGKRMLPMLRRCYDSAMGAKELARAAARSEVIPVKMLISHTVNLEHVMGPIASLFRTFPKAQLRLVRGRGDEMVAAMRDGTFDVAIAGPIDNNWDRIDDWPLWTEGFVAALPEGHAKASLASLSAGDLAGQPIVSQSHCESRDDLLAWMSAQGHAVHTHDVITQQDVVNVVAAGLGVALVPESAPLAPGIRRIRVDGLDVTRTVSAYVVSGRPRCAPVMALLSLLRARDVTASAA